MCNDKNGHQKEQGLPRSTAVPSLFSLMTFIRKQTKFRSIKGYMKVGINEDKQILRRLLIRERFIRENLSVYSIFGKGVHVRARACVCVCEAV